MELYFRVIMNSDFVHLTIEQPLNIIIDYHTLILSLKYKIL